MQRAPRGGEKSGVLTRNRSALWACRGWCRVARPRSLQQRMLDDGALLDVANARTTQAGGETPKEAATLDVNPNGARNSPRDQTTC